MGVPPIAHPTCLWVQTLRFTPVRLVLSHSHYHLVPFVHQRGHQSLSCLSLGGQYTQFLKISLLSRSIGHLDNYRKEFIGIFPSDLHSNGTMNTYFEALPATHIIL